MANFDSHFPKINFPAPLKSTTHNLKVWLESGDETDAWDYSGTTYAEDAAAGLPYVIDGAVSAYLDMCERKGHFADGYPDDDTVYVRETASGLLYKTNVSTDWDPTWVIDSPVLVPAQEP